MITCPSCNAFNPDNYQFCQFCGSKLTHEFIRSVSDDLEITSLLETASEVSEVNSTTTENSNDVEAQSQDGNHELEESIDDAIAFTRPIQLTSAPLDIEEVLEQDLEVLINPSPDQENVDLSLNSTLAIPSKHIQNVYYAGKTDVGRERNRNEDDFTAIFQTFTIHGKSQISDRNHRGLFVLCDGMGGHEGGIEASRIAVNSIIEQFQPFWIDTLPGEKKLHEIISNANQSIFKKNEDEQRLALGRMGTTLVMLALHDLNVVIAHVGDSRIYQVANSQLVQLTRDHEVYNQLIDLGMDRNSAMARPDAHQLTQALGPNCSDRLEPNIQFFNLTEPTLFLLCSDGLCDNNVIEQHWQAYLLPILNKEIDVETGLERIIELGNNMNGHDNITAILILCEM
ncbi:MAG: protein phosphatase 2C domain-containing protein [Pseudanabaena sp.]|jgi:serine/threonine protein phosphatase PrpC